MRMTPLGVFPVFQQVKLHNFFLYQPSETSSFTAGVNAERVTRTDKTSFYFNIIKADVRVDGESENTGEAVRGGISYDHDASERFFCNLFNDYEYDRFQDLDLRLAAAGGMGYKAIKTAVASEIGF
jgi:hypothetical protein